MRFISLGAFSTVSEYMASSCINFWKCKPIGELLVPVPWQISIRTRFQIYLDYLDVYFFIFFFQSLSSEEISRMYESIGLIILEGDLDLIKKKRFNT